MDMKQPLIAEHTYEWDTGEMRLITKIQKDELQAAWLHNRMYETLTSYDYKLGWAVSILGLIAGIIGFLLATVIDTTWNTAGGIIAGIIGLLITFISRQSDRLNLSSNAESHRLIAANHTGLYDDIGLIKSHPTQPADLFLQVVKSVIKSIRDNSMNLMISDEVRDEWVAECKARGISEYDAFDQLKEITVELQSLDSIMTPRQSLPSSTTPAPQSSLQPPQPQPPSQPQPQHPSQPQPQPQHHEEFEDVITLQAPSLPQTNPIKQPEATRGYDPKKLALELDRLKDWQ